MRNTDIRNREVSFSPQRVRWMRAVNVGTGRRPVIGIPSLTVTARRSVHGGRALLCMSTFRGAAAFLPCFRAKVPTAENLDSATTNVNNFWILLPADPVLSKLTCRLGSPAVTWPGDGLERNLTARCPPGEDADR
jgi:hypothetical protein